MLQWHVCLFWDKTHGQHCGIWGSSHDLAALSFGIFATHKKNTNFPIDEVWAAAGATGDTVKFCEGCMHTSGKGWAPGVSLHRHKFVVELYLWKFASFIFSFSFSHQVPLLMSSCVFRCPFFLSLWVQQRTHFSEVSGYFALSFDSAILKAEGRGTWIDRFV